MNSSLPPDADGELNREDLLAVLLSAYDESLALREELPIPLADAPQELRPRLADDLLCVQLLQQLRPGGRSKAGGTDSDGIEAPRDVQSNGESEGRYTLLHLHASGGIGRVWLARDLELGRTVALKELLPERENDPIFRARFLHEARITSQLEHPGVVPVYGLERGTEGGQPAYAMRFLHGRTLSEAIQEYHRSQRSRRTAPLDQLSLLNAFVSVCHTVAYAHSRGVVHCDLKGQNVIVGDFGEVVVLDWGFATILDSAKRQWDETAGAWRMSPALGTPAYMAPEQATGQPVDVRTDVYGLGGILYEILAGQPPFTGTDTREILERARSADSPRPRDICRTAPRALEPICLRALARDPGQRYASASDLAQDVQRWLADEPVLAYPDPLRARLGRFARRHRTAVVLAAVLVAAALLGAMLAGQQRMYIAELRAAASAEQTRIEALARQRLEQHLYVQRIALAERELAAHNVNRAATLLASCQDALRGWEWHCLNRLCQAEVLTLSGHSAAVSCVAFDPRGHALGSSSHDGTIKLWNARDGRLTRTLAGHSDVVYSIAYSPDGRRLASASWDRTVKIWDVESGRELLTFRGHPTRVIRVAFSPDGERLASMTSTEIKVWEAGTGRELRTIVAQEELRFFYGLAYGPPGRDIAAGCGDGTVRFWDVASGEETLKLRGHGNYVKNVTFSADGRFLASGDGDIVRGDPGEVRVWDVQSGDVVFTLRGHTDQIYATAFTPDGRRLVSASQDSTIKLWDLESGLETLALHHHSDTVRSVAFSPDGWRLSSACEDGTIKIFNATPWAHERPDHELLTYRRHQDRVFSLAFSGDGQTLVSASNSDQILTWETSGNDRQSYQLSGEPVFAVAVSPDDRLYAAGTSGGAVVLLDAMTGTTIRTLQTGLGPVKSLAFSPDGQLIAAANWHRAVHLWDVSGLLVHTLAGHGDAVLGVSFSPDGRFLASASYDQSVKIWDVRTGGELITLDGHESRVFSLAFSPDGSCLASASNDGTLILWDTRTWQRIRTLRGHAAGVCSVAFSPDGRRLASSSYDWTVRLWEVATGHEVRIFRGHEDCVAVVAFSPSGNRLASGSFDRTVKIWDVSAETVGTPEPSGDDSSKINSN